MEDSVFDFLEEDNDNDNDNDNANHNKDSAYKVIIADDDEAVHAISNLILKDFIFEDKRLSIINTYSGEETKQVLAENPDAAVLLLDVVMESHDAGLDVVDFIRNELNNHTVRVILRTGQPGQAPEKMVISNYDINDYLLKTEITNMKLFTSIYSALRSYRDILAVKEAMKSLEEAEKELRINNRELKNEIKERERIEAELLRSNVKLQEADRLKMDFLSAISHELRTPLTSIFGFSKIIKKKFEEVVYPYIDAQNKVLVRAFKQLNNNIDIVLSEGQKLTSLINDLLDIAKLEAGKADWQEEEMNIAEIIERVVKITQPAIEENKLIIDKDIQNELPLLTGDRKKIIQVLHKLINNAIKFTSEGTITCQAFLRQDDTIQVSVSDTGVGIDDDNLELIFEKFKQVGDVMHDKPAGVGLGLSICKEIIDRHGGEIWAESTPGKGSIFSFTLPCGIDDADL